MLVSGDGDYIPALKKQAEQGKKIFILATEVSEFPGSRPIVSNQLKEDFNFIELASFKDKIMRHELQSCVEGESEGVDREKRSKPKRFVNMEVVLTLVGSAGVVGNFVVDLGDIIAKYPGMKSHFNSELVHPAPVELVKEFSTITNSQNPKTNDL